MYPKKSFVNLSDDLCVPLRAENATTITGTGDDGSEVGISAQGWIE